MFRNFKRMREQAEEGRTEKRHTAKYRRLQGPYGPNVLLSGINAASLPVTTTGWQGLPTRDFRLYNRQQLVEEHGFKYLKWDGM
jgi:hypothetical protein